jgi:glycosyltransferase involved in cell wall biosynthesis
VRVMFGTYPWAHETPGGGEIQLQKYAECLPGHGVEVARHDPWRANLDQSSVFHFFSCIGGSYHFCNYIRQRGLPLVISSSLWITEATKADYPIGEIRDQLALADVIVTNSDTESDQLAGVLALPRDRFSTVLNGFDARFANAEPALFRDKLGIGGPFILNVGNIEPRKNQLLLARTAKRLELPLVLIGHSRDAAYADQVMAEGGSTIRYLGPIEHQDPLLGAAYAACAVFALPSTLETPGLAALEAAAAGAPIVITSEGSTRDYFADHAHYVDPHNCDDLIRSVDAALKAGPNIALKAHAAATLNWTTVTQALLPIYRQAVQRRDQRHSPG